MFHYSLLQALHDRERYQEDRDIPDDLHEEPASHTFKDDGSRFGYQLRQKRISGILKTMLKDAGYGDLAKMAAIKRERGNENVD